MKRKPLSETNPYLKNSKQRADMIRAHVITSTAIEGVHIKDFDKITSEHKTISHKP
jgi:hypothetical protein